MQLQTPHLLKTSTSKQLIVNGKPFLMLAAELQNSSLTSAKYMREAWPKLVQANINTVLGCVSWEQIEPTEGKFDFQELDQCIQDARAAGLKLVLLWFGSFKNGISTYTPHWVKKDSQRFPRAKTMNSLGELEISDTLSIFHTEAPAADARAFSTLMKHLREVDCPHSTVIMVQVENEIGLLGDSRDRSRLAENKFSKAVPSDLLDFLNKDWESLRPELKQSLKITKDSANSWCATFGHSKKTDELFMAYHYARYVEQVASAGRKEYALPLYTNVWQNYVADDAEDNEFPVVVGGGGVPGDYPSGGGVINTIDIWQTFAPTLDFIAPDVYLNDYTKSCAKYRHRNQPLFIPEQRRDEYGARRIWNAIGSFQALCTSPFGIDTLEPKTNPFRVHYGLLAQVSDHVLQAQADGTSVGFFFDELPETAGLPDPSPPTTARFGPWKVTIERSFVFGRPGSGWGMVIHKGGPRFLLIGKGFQVRFAHESAPFTGILSFEEKEVQADGSLKTLRMLNGDESRSGKFCIMPNDEPDYGG
ncbi:uncharacterized protein LTR77_008314 [Saxophila tyrrhenica]|uniref:Beta-galactosidase n=1 Tax=Saxophila tyrrhenica TaxID=1690608 RepID=A0AAV9P4H6_9PEZI|nr:hypothetical protein LTR77_008314 [Saxophila tyrrhenica]